MHVWYVESPCTCFYSFLILSLQFPPPPTPRLHIFYWVIPRIYPYELLSFYPTIFFLRTQKLLLERLNPKKRKKERKKKYVLKLVIQSISAHIIFRTRRANKQNNSLESFFKHFLRISNFCTRNWFYKFALYS